MPDEGAGRPMRIARAIAGNAKAAAGALLLLAFVVLAVVPGCSRRDDPTAQAYPRNLEASTAHLLGTTGLGQDTFAQAGVRTRQVLEIAFGPGWRARCWPRSSACGGLPRRLDGRGAEPVHRRRLVIPLFPLLIVIAATSTTPAPAC